MKTTRQSAPTIAPPMQHGDGPELSEPATRSRRVLCCDTYPLVLLGFRELLKAQEDLICCGEVQSDAELRNAVRSQRPELLVLDLWLNGADGLELVKALHAEFPELRMLICSQLEESLYAERALRAGAMGYIAKDRPTAELLTAIRLVLDGELYLSRKMSALMVRQHIMGNGDARSSGVNALTDRELQVFSLLGAGVGSREVADKLHISVKTVETYRENIKHKLGLRDAAELLHHAALFVDGRAAAPEKPAKEKI